MKNKFLKSFAVILALMMMLMAFASCDMLNFNGGNEGASSTTPQIKIGDDGFWYVSYDDGETWSSLGVSAKGEKGDKGDKGDDGEKGEKGDKGDKGDSADILDLPSYSDGFSGLAFYLLPDDTYGVMAGNTTYTENIVIPETHNGKAVTQILPKAFYKANNLKSITIPESVTSIGSSAFQDCSSLTDITIPNSVTSIGSYAFDGCSSLKYNEYNNGKYLGNSKNPYIVLVDIIDGSATSFTIPDTTKVIYSSAFEYCSSLTDITIPNSVTSVGSYAFYNCSSLTSVYITDIAKWCSIEFKSDTYGCYANPLYYAKNLYLNGNLVTELKIPDGVTVIKPYAFYGCSSLTSVTIPDSVKSIGDDAFYGCSSLTSVTIGNSVTSIGSSAFYYCSKLTSVEFKNTKGWEAGSTAISFVDLANTSKAATYLKSTYYNYTWTRS